MCKSRKVEVEHKWNNKVVTYYMGHAVGDVVLCKSQRKAFRTRQVHIKRPNICKSS